MSEIHKGNTKNCKKIIHPNEFTEKSLDESPIHLNHYAIQSKNWFKMVKSKRGDAYRNKNFRNDNYFKMYDFNDIVDNELSNLYSR
jgi:hypothetical protein